MPIALIATIAMVLCCTDAAYSQDWIGRSNALTRPLLDVDSRHLPEEASSQGLIGFDRQTSVFTRADQDRRRSETDKVLKQLRTALAAEKDLRVARDLSVSIHHADYTLRRMAYDQTHKVTFLDAGKLATSGVEELLQAPTTPARKAAALIRLRRYAGLEHGVAPLAFMARQYTIEQMRRKNVGYPLCDTLTAALNAENGRGDHLAQTLRGSGLSGWEAAYRSLRSQLQDYDGWTRQAVLPKCRNDDRLDAADYALFLEGAGIDQQAADLARQGHQSFATIQAEMTAIAAAIARQRGLPSARYQDVIQVLRGEQLSDQLMLPIYRDRTSKVEQMVRDHALFKLPARAADLRPASPDDEDAGIAQVVAPPLMRDTGKRAYFQVPLLTTGAPKDYTYRAATWPLAAHESRPGHVLQIDTVLDEAIPLARRQQRGALASVEGWAVYAESVVQPYMPLEGQLAMLDMRLARAAHTFLDPELHAGLISRKQAEAVLRDQVGLEDGMVKIMVGRYIKSPGALPSYFYGLTQFAAIRREAEAALGARFDQERFHEFVLSQGFVPFGVMRKAVLETFVPSQQH